MKLAYMYATPDVTHGNVTAAQGDMAAVFALIRRTGYSGVELLVRDPRAIDAAALESAARAEGLDLPAICTGEVYGEDHVSFADPDPRVRVAARDRMLAALDLAARFGAMVNVGRLRGRFTDGVPREQTLDWMVEAVAACATERPEVAIVMEPVNRQYANCLLTTAETLDFVRRVGLPNVGIMLDSVHMTVEGENPLAAMEVALPWFWHFHISDSERLPVGAGTYEIAPFFDALRRVAFQRYVTVETFQVPDAEHAIETSYRSLERYFG